MTSSLVAFQIRHLRDTSISAEVEISSEVINLLPFKYGITSTWFVYPPCSDSNQLSKVLLC